ncbi:MAG: TonB family protein [Acidobacteria bacterium]|nr:TonB family protein [Acidobacteriota bacterium]
MKFCPTCQTKYDEEILRFCIKDGTPLVDEKQPEFTEIPSEIEDDDPGEQTVIRRNKPSTPLPPPVSSQSGGIDKGSSSQDIPGPAPDSDEQNEAKRIVIPTSETPREQAVRPRENALPQSRHSQPRKSNAALIALVSIFGTIIVLGAMAGIFWFLTSQNSNDSNQNANINTNLDENIDDNFNADDLLNNINTGNANDNANLDDNINVNTETPTPTKTPTPTPSPSPSPDENANVNSNINSNMNQTNANIATPTKTPTPAASPTPAPVKTPTPSTNTNQPVNVGQINGRAISLPTPKYTPAARLAKASGRVTVRVLVDENGNVVAANATSGHPLLRQEAEIAARRSRFKPVLVGGHTVRSTGTIAYNFVN